MDALIANLPYLIAAQENTFIPEPERENIAELVRAIVMMIRRGEN